MWLLIAFIAVPLIEIGLFIKIGGWLTLWPTLAIVLATGIIGTVLVRQQGLKVLAELQGSLNEMRDPLSPLAHGALILFAGALLLTPGFFTDTVGFLLLVPAIRRYLISIVASKVTIATAHSQPRHRHESIIIDAEFEDVTNKPASDKPSGWTRH